MHIQVTRYSLSLAQRMQHLPLHHNHQLYAISDAGILTREGG